MSSKQSQVLVKCTSESILKYCNRVNTLEQ